jgi:hypothetical protein
MGKEELVMAHKKWLDARFWSMIGSFVCLIAIAAIAYWRFKYASSFAGSWDEVDFARSLDRFDLLAMQPHFPGYPYFVLGGMWVHSWIIDPARALSLLNASMMLLSAIPLYWLGRRLYSPFMSLLLVLFVQSPVYLWILSTQPMSDGTAIAVLCWYLWSLKLAQEKRGWTLILLPAFCFGILMGVRVSYAPFGLGLLLLWLQDWKQEPRAYPKRLISLISSTVIFQLVWISGLVASEGSLGGFIALAKSFLFGHFEKWGGGVAASSDSLVARLYRFFIDDLIWVGLSGHSLWVVFGLSVLFILALMGILPQSRIHKGRDYFLALILMLLAYALWILLGQNPDKPRHIAPLASGVMLLIFVALFPNSQRQERPKQWQAKIMLLLCVVTLMTFEGAKLSKEQATELPVTYQLAEYVQKLPAQGIIYTWEETRVLSYLHVNYAHKQIFTFDYFLQEVNSYSKNKPVYVTDRALEGFERQVGDLSGKVKPIATFHCNPLLDPVYHDVTLYEWVHP